MRPFLNKFLLKSSLGDPYPGIGVQICQIIRLSALQTVCETCKKEKALAGEISPFIVL